MATIDQVQVRCADCNRRLADFVNEVQGGQLILELKCPRCGHPHVEIIRAPTKSDSVDAHSATSALPARAVVT